MIRPTEPYSTTLTLLNATYSKVKGVNVKKYEPVGNIHCKFKTYGGTEIKSDGMYAVKDTATVETWWRPDITSASQFKLGDKTYEVIGEPENVLMRNQTLIFKIQAVRGGA